MGLWKQFTGGVRRVFQNWNVENRAMRAIDRPDRAAPPRYPTEERMIAEVAREDPIPKSQIPGLETEKNPVLDDWLKKVKVYSKDVPLHPSFEGPVEQDPRKHISQKPLPQQRAPPQQDEFGMVRSSSNLPVPPGKVTLKTALQLISSYQQDSSVWTVPALSRQFNVTEEDAASLIRYFGVFSIHVPQKDEDPKVVDMKSYFGMSAIKDIPIFKLQHEDKYYQIPAHMEGPSAERMVQQEDERMDREDKEMIMQEKMREAGVDVPTKEEQDEPVHRLLKPVNVEERVRSLKQKKTA